MRRPRGVIVTNLYPTPQEPARATFNQQQFAHLQKLHDLRIIVPRPHRYPCVPRCVADPRRAPGDPEVIYIDVWHPPGAGRLVNASLLAAAVQSSLYRSLASWAPDYVLGSFAYPDGVGATRLARRLDVPAFVKVHGSDINLMAQDPAIRWQVRRMMRRVRGVVAVSGALVQQVIRLGAPAQSTLLLYNGIDQRRFYVRDLRTCRANVGLPLNRRSILYVGNLKQAKGIFDLLEAFAALAEAVSDVDLEYVGVGPNQAQLEAAVAGKGLGQRVRLHGEKSHAEIAEWIGACTIACLPSHAEGVPNVVLEAQACGRPVVATDVGGIPEVLGGSGGHLVPAQRPDLLAAALRETLQAEWNPTTLAAGVPVKGWPDNAQRLSEFILARCAQPGELAAPVRGA